MEKGYKIYTEIEMLQINLMPQLKINLHNQAILLEAITDELITMGRRKCNN